MQHRGRGTRGDARTVVGAAGRELVDDAIDVLVVGIVLVVGELASQEQAQDQAAGDAQRQPGNVDGGVELLPPQHAQQHHKIVVHVQRARLVGHDLAVEQVDDAVAEGGVAPASA